MSITPNSIGESSKGLIGYKEGRDLEFGFTTLYPKSFTVKKKISNPLLLSFFITFIVVSSNPNIT